MLKKLRAQRGSVAVQIGIALIVLLGFVAMGSEITFLLLKKRNMQSAADGAAYSGAVALVLNSSSKVVGEAQAVAGSVGFADGVDNVTVTVNTPPLSGHYAGNANAVEVIVSQPQILGLTTLFHANPIGVAARAVAVTNPSSFCILALDPTASAALMVWNNAVVSNPNCGVAVNSSSSSGLTVRNNGAINGGVHVHGDWQLQINAQLAGSPNVNNAPIIDDPFADVDILTPPACTGQSASGSGTINLDPGHFCDGFNFGNNAIVNLAPGSYYVDKMMDFGIGDTVNATGGVTLIVNGDYALDFANNGTLHITAPSSGPYAGLALMGGRTAAASVTHIFSNNTQMFVEGAIYFPNQAINFLNNQATGQAKCTIIIARLITIRNNVWLNNDCSLTGTPPIGTASAQLVE